MSPLPRCMYAVRYKVSDTTWRYRRVTPFTPMGAGFMPQEPPPVGDLVTLWDSSGHQPEGGPTFRVIARSWSYPSYGSGSWPYSKSEPTEGPLVDIIVEPASGLYLNEAPTCSEMCGAYWDGEAWQVPPEAEPEATDGHVHTRTEEN